MTTRTQRATLGDAELVRHLQALRRTDNSTNFVYIARAWALIAVSAGVAIGCHQWLVARDGSPWWAVPVFFLASIVIGASQHQLAGATHEATHHTLFRNRLLNELASDWLCMFPLFSSTHIFRIHHLSHHQFINDPRRDPDFAQLQASGHWLDFPLTAADACRALLRHTWPPSLVRYMVVRARVNAMGDARGVYDLDDAPATPVALWLGVLFLLLVPTVLGVGLFRQAPLILFGGPIVLWAALGAVYLVAPLRWFSASRLRSVLAPRVAALSRTAFLVLLFCAVAWTEAVTGAPAAIYFYALWIFPIFTSFSFFMILRQVVQHGNGDRGRLTNTRTFLVNPFVRYAVFPFGMDYHLPHHMYPSVPHHRLPELHAVLSSYPEYREAGIVVEGYFRPPSDAAPRNPTVIEVLGPEYARRTGQVFVDDSVMDDWEFDEKDRILAQGAAERARAGAAGRSATA